MTRREVLQDILAYLVGQKLAQREPKREHFEDEPGIDKNGIVIRPQNKSERR